MTDARDKLRTMVRGGGGQLITQPAPMGTVRASADTGAAPVAAADQNLTPRTPDDGSSVRAHDQLRPMVHEAPPLPANPGRRTIWHTGGISRLRSRLRRLARWIYFHTPGRPPTAIERRIKAERQARRQIERLLREESQLYRQRITNALTRLNLCYHYPKSKNDFMMAGVQKVKFDTVVMQPEALYLRIDTAHLPRGVNIMQLVAQDVLTDITLSCGQRVTAEYTERIGCWYVIERATGARGIPNHVSFAEMMGRVQDVSDPLMVPFGMQSNNREVFRSLSEMVHMLVAGTTGAGKSNFVNAMLCTLITRNSPDNLKLILVDLKGGMELNPYAGIPHILHLPGFDEIVNHRDQVPGVLQWLFDEGERRIKIIEAGHHRSISSYNKNRRVKLPRIVLLIDEWADVVMDTKLKNRAETILTNVCQRFRAVGVHVVLCTQRPEVKVVSGNIKGVLPAKVAFNCTNNASSMVILDNASAKGLVPVGRCVLQFNGDYEIQTPYMPDDLVVEMVAAVRAGKLVAVGEMRKHDVTPEEIMRWALAQPNHAGELSQRLLFSTFRQRGLGLEELRAWLTSWEGLEFEVNGALYRVEAGIGTKPRRLVAVLEPPPAPAP